MHLSLVYGAMHELTDNLLLFGTNRLIIFVITQKNEIFASDMTLDLNLNSDSFSNFEIFWQY